MKSLIALVLTVLTFGACTPARSPVQDPVFVTTESTVALLDDMHPFCAGVWVAPAWILTAQHCTQGDEDKPLKSITLKFHRGGTAQGEVTFRDEKHDLALLHVAEPPLVHVVARLADTDPGIGEPLHVVGHPQGMLWSYTDASVAAYRQTEDIEGAHEALGLYGPWMQLSGSFWFGNSGGGAFNHANELVGIASFKPKMPNAGFMVPASTIRSFLKAHTP